MFWLNYRVTVWIHICFALGLTFLQLFGDSIDCSMDTVDKNIIDSYCWSIGTWTLGKKFTLIHAFLNQYEYFTEKQDNPEGLLSHFNLRVRFFKFEWKNTLNGCDLFRQQLGPRQICSDPPYRLEPLE